MIEYQNVLTATFKQTMRHLVPGIILAFGVGAAGAALAQTVAPEVAPVTTAAIPAMTLDDCQWTYRQRTEHPGDRHYRRTGTAHDVGFHRS